MSDTENNYVLCARMTREFGELITRRLCYTIYIYIHICALIYKCIKLRLVLVLRPFLLDIFALPLLDNFNHFLTVLAYFRFNVILLAARVDAARRVRISRRRTKLAVCSLNANFIVYRALAFQFWPRGVFAFTLCSTYKPHDDKPNLHQQTEKTMNNHSSNLNGSNMYDPWVIKCVVKSVRTNLTIRDTTSLTVTI